ncbi:MAG: zinc-ribbon domain-containing protein [Clostridia bacterium]|nr:zinc-ribbon domain-containing protein [Clostridia bacterium]
MCLFPTREQTHRYGLKTYWKCKKCGNYNLDEEKTCSKCGEEKFFHHKIEEKEESNGKE